MRRIFLPTVGHDLAGGVAPVGSFVSRADAAYAAGVTRDVIRTWISRGWQDAKGKQRKVATRGLEVDIDDVLQAELDTRRKTQRSHRRLAA